MIIYKLQESGSSSMGFPTLEEYYQREEDARKAFDAQITKHKKGGSLAKKSDLDGAKPIRVNENPESFGQNVLREAWLSVWDSYNTDCGDEWDIGAVHLKIIGIDVKGADSK